MVIIPLTSETIISSELFIEMVYLSLELNSALIILAEVSKAMVVLSLIALLEMASLGGTCRAYQIFVTLFTQPQFEAWIVYT